MSIGSITSSVLYSQLQITLTSQINQANGQGNGQTIQSEFQQLGQDLQAGNLT